MSNRVDGNRLWSHLMAMAEIGPAAHGGCNRQAISDEDEAGRALLLEWATAAGCTSETDEIGNLFIRRAGRDNSLPPVMVGSHLDTQPTGGRFDGVFGVLGGFEVIESLNDMGQETDMPVELVVWTNEEGSRFQYSMMGSAVWAGHLDLTAALDLVDNDGLSVADELNRLGWAGTRPAAPRPFTAAFELHIEQGPILEAEESDIGVVTGVQGFRWYTIRIIGDEAHAGPTPMEVRHDPAAAIARIINDVYATAADLAPWGRATFAQFRSEPVSPNTVPGVLTSSLDLRNPELAKLNEAEDRMRAGVAAAAAATGVEIEITVDMDSPPVAFDAGCIAAVQASVDELGLHNQRMVSGAGHDACYVANCGPTSMIFVPCDGGVSHNEAENITSEQAERGASVLLGAVLRATDGEIGQ
jgi:N-carbamoyl-L-amino-acid hydrolase